MVEERGVDLASSDPRALNFALLLDLMRIDRIRIVSEFYKVSELAHLERAKIVLAAELMGTVTGACASTKTGNTTWDPRSSTSASGAAI